MDLTRIEETKSLWHGNYFLGLESDVERRALLGFNPGVYLIL